MDLPQQCHLDASAGRPVVFCHLCNHEWYQDEHGLQCPRCGGDFTEIVTQGQDDPRQVTGNSLEEDVRRFDRSPHPYHRVGRHGDNDSDPEEGDIDELTQRGPSSFIPPTIFDIGPGARQNSRPTQNPASSPHPPRQTAEAGDRTTVLRRFHEMLTNDFQVGAAGRSGRETLFPEQPSGSSPTIFQRQVTYSTASGGRGGVTMSFTLGGGPSPPPNPFDQILNSIMGATTLHPAGPGPADAGQPETPGRGGRNGPPMMGGDPGAIFAILLGALGGSNGVHGDAVYTQEAMDRILSQLMEQSQGSNAPPPASQQAIDNLPRKKLDKEMLPEGKGECTICIQDVETGDEVMVLPCSHWYHEECIIHWLREHGTCPVCRKPVDPEGAQGSGPNPTPTGGSSGIGSGHPPSPFSTTGSPPFIFNFGSSSSSSSTQHHQSSQRDDANPPPNSVQGNRSHQNAPEARMARLNAIRNAAGLPSEQIHRTPSSSSTHHSHRVHSRSRSPPSTNSHRHSMFGSFQDRNRERGPDISRERDRDRRGIHLIMGGSPSLVTPPPNSENGAAGRNNGNETSESSSGNSNSGGAAGPIMGWLRNQFPGRRS